jgi:hypothetical protein
MKSDYGVNHNTPDQQVSDDIEQKLFQMICEVYRGANAKRMVLCKNFYSRFALVLQVIEISVIYRLARCQNEQIIRQ